MRKPFVLVATAVLASPTALAHHSPSAFDVMAEVVVEGTLTKVDWANPHIYLTVDAAGPGGQRVQQQVEAVSIAAAQSAGLTRDRLTVGSPVVVRAHPNRRGAGYTVLGADITFRDGNTYALGATGRRTRPPVATQPASGLAGSWAPPVNPLLVPTVHGWPLTDKARATLTRLLTDIKGISIGCTSSPPPMLMQLPQLRTIELRDDRVVLKVDADGVDATRVIHLDLAAQVRDVDVDRPVGRAPLALMHQRQQIAAADRFRHPPGQFRQHLKLRRGDVNGIADRRLEPPRGQVESPTLEGGHAAGRDPIGGSAGGLFPPTAP